MATYVRPHVIALLTDFGWEDPYVGCVKGAIMKINPSVQVLDVCHTLPAHDIASASFLLGCVYRDFPEKTIFVCVVDPGVGSERPILIATVGLRYFIAPDNGLLTTVLEDPDIGSVIRVTEAHFYTPSPSRTFHARDIMAPLAGWITKNVAIENMGERFTEYTKIEIPKPRLLGGALIQGRISLIDRFGNCITNISRQHVETVTGSGKKFSKIVVNGREITTFCEYYAQSPGANHPVCLFGSLGYVEIACNQGSACATLGVNVGAEVGLVFD